MRQLTLYRYGSVDSSYLQQADYYLALLSKYFAVDIRELKDPGRVLTSADLPEVDGNCWLLSEHGKQFDTREFTKLIFADYSAPLRLILLNAFGVDTPTLTKFPNTLSLSRLTMAHDLAWLVLLEQLYRAGNINAGGKYHK